MGADLNYESISILKNGELDYDAIEKQWNAMIASDLHDNGHYYSGTIGMLGYGFIRTKVKVGNQQYAIDYIEENHKKWDNAICVEFINDKGELSVLIGGWCSS